MNLELANRERDRRLRRTILMALDNAKRYGIRGDLDGVTLMDVVNGGQPEAQRSEDEQHSMGLIRDLANKGMVHEERYELRRGERYGLRHMRLKILDKGSRLLKETEPADPDIWDDRATVD